VPSNETKPLKFFVPWGSRLGAGKGHPGREAWQSPDREPAFTPLTVAGSFACGPKSRPAATLGPRKKPRRWMGPGGRALVPANALVLRNRFSPPTLGGPNTEQGGLLEAFPQRPPRPKSPHSSLLPRRTPATRIRIRFLLLEKARMMKSCQRLLTAARRSTTTSGDPPIARCLPGATRP